jgi:uncharacterized protein (DUF3084 family)
MARAREEMARAREEMARAREEMARAREEMARAREEMARAREYVSWVRKNTTSSGRMRWRISKKQASRVRCSSSKVGRSEKQACTGNRFP